MTDTMTPERRSALMSKVRGKNTKPELAVERLLDERGVDYTRFVKVSGYSVDFLLSPRTVLEVKGCLWHLHGDCFRWPKSRREFWFWHLMNSRRLDVTKTARQLMAGFAYHEVWECEIKDGNVVLPQQGHAVRVPRLSWDQLGYLMGFVMGDGSVQRDRARGAYRVWFYNSNPAPMNRIWTTLVDAGLHPLFRLDQRDPHHPAVGHIYVTSKWLYNALAPTKVPGSYLAFPRIPDMGFNAGLVRGFFEAEGNWNGWGVEKRKRQARFYSKREENLTQLAGILSSLGIESRTYPCGHEYYLAVYRRESYGRLVEMLGEESYHGEKGAGPVPDALGALP